MRIAIENVGTAVKAADLRRVVAALNKQLADFTRFWSVGATCQVGNSSTADAVVFLRKDTPSGGVLGYHTLTAAGRPYGVVYTTLATRLGEPWSVTLSHEVLETAADPEANRYALGVHPTEDRDVFYWYEVCDPVQDESYMQDGVPVSNFVLPLYFTEGDEVGTLDHNDFMRATGKVSGSLSSLGLAPGGYVGFYDPTTRTDEVVFADARSRARHAIRAEAGASRRAARYRMREGTPPVATPAPAAVTHKVLRTIPDRE